MVDMLGDELYKDEDILRELYWDKGMSLGEVADEIGCGLTTVYRWMEKYNIERRTAKQNKLPRPHITSESHTNSGYEEIRINNGSIQHHRLIAVSEWGFDCVVDRDVHHKNGLEWDNRPSNLELLEHGEHSKQHRLNEHDEALWRDEEKLYRLYHEEHLSLNEIADRWGCGHSTVANWMEKHRIERRSSGKPSHSGNRGGEK